jgi:hypothetical protein
MKKNISLLLAAFFIHTFTIAESDIKLIKNSLSEIDSKLGKISMQLVRTWNDEEENDFYFKTPADIVVDSENNVYIADSALHCINVFNSKGRFIRKIGTHGQGPGDILTPLHIGLDSNNILCVYEFGNRRIQFFSEKGVSFSIIKVDIPLTSNLVFPSKRQIALKDYYSARKGGGIISVLNDEGVKVQKIGTGMLPPRVALPWRGGEYDSHEISYCTKTKQYYIAYKYSQMIQVFQKTGQFSSCIFYDTPINKLKMKWQSKNSNFDLITKKKEYSECTDLSIDDDGRIFVIVTTRQPLENERKSMLFLRDGAIQYYPRSKEFPEKTDMYRLMVLGTDGKILAAKQLNFFCDNIYIHKNRIFIIDMTFNRAIYEFKYAIEN